MNEICSLDCELVPDNDLCASVEDDETLDANVDNVNVVSRTYTGIDTDDIDVTVDNENYTISATIKPFDWLEYTTEDWQQTISYYKLVIPFSTHKCLNAYVDSMLISSQADSGDENDAAGYENNIPTWKLLTNDSIVIKADTPVNCKVLIKGDR